MLDGLHFQIKKFRQLAGERVAALLVAVFHFPDSLNIGHIPDDTGQLLHTGQLTTTTAAVARNDLIARPVLFGADGGGGHNAVFLDRPHQIHHGGIVHHLERVFPESMERMELAQLDIDGFALLNGTGRGCWLFGLCRDLSSRGGITANGYRLRGGRLLLGGSGFFTSGHFVSRFGRLGLVGGRLIRLGWAASAGLCRRLLFSSLGRCLLRFFSFRGTATAGFFLFSRNLLLRLFLRGLFCRFCIRDGIDRLHSGSINLRGGGLGLFHGITGSRPAFCHQLFDLVKRHDNITGFGHRCPSLFLLGDSSGQIRGRGIGAGNIRDRRLGSNRLAFGGGNIFVFLHLLTSNLSVILHKNELENFVLIF